MAVVNSIWQACERGISPERVMLLASPNEPAIKRSVDTVLRYLDSILPNFAVSSPNIEQKDINEDDFLGFRNTLGAVLTGERRSGYRVVVDTTPGRKYMSAFALAHGTRTHLKLEKVFYNHMLAQRYNDVPHPLIPRHEQQLYDLLEVLRR